jgi:putative ABC transport system permease protein
MFRNFLKITLRNVQKYKVYSLINILGLVMGLMICLVLGYYVVDDLTFDRFITNADRIFRLITIETPPGQDKLTYSIITGPLLPAVKENIPEILGATRVYSFGNVRLELPSSASDEQVDESSIIRGRSLVTDPGFFDVFSFKLLSGEPSALENTGIFLTPALASALFGEENPIGKAVKVNSRDGYVAGLVECPPFNSHLQFEVILPLHVEDNPLWMDSWENLMLSGYIRIHKNADPDEVEEKVYNLALSNDFPKVYNIKLQPLPDIHLGSSHHRYDGLNRNKNNASVVYALAVIGAMILIIAAINFINLSSARSALRAREVGLRKVVGSKRRQIILQFLCESIFMCFMAAVLVLLLLRLTQKPIENFIKKPLPIDFFSNPSLLIVVFITALVVGLLSGLYPALILSGFRPIEVLRGRFHSGKSGQRLRQFLVVFQFAISIALILGIFTVMDQIKYLKSRDMGYNREQVLIVNGTYNRGEDLFKNRLQNVPGVISTGRINQTPNSVFTRVEMIPDGADRAKSFMAQRFFVNEGLVPTLEITMKYGRNFSPEFASDAQEGILINEAAVRLAGWEGDPVGRQFGHVNLESETEFKQVVGVFKDFHYSNTRQKIEPMVFFYNPGAGGRFLVRLPAGAVAENLTRIENIYKDVFPDRSFNYTFFDDVFDQQFQRDKNFAAHMGFFSGVAVIIACLGLLGLVAFEVEQRKKEIAVRRVLGANEWKIVKMLAVNFLRWVMVANIIAWPLEIFGMNRWLDSFAYRVPLRIPPFFAAGAAAVLIAMITISYQSIKAARTDPVIALRQDN